MLLRLINFIKNYLVIFVSGDFPERFLNLCTLRGIYLWDACKTDDGIYVKTSVKGFRNMLIPAKRSRCRIKIVEKRGLSFLLRKHRKRKVLIGGCAAFAAALIILNSFVWVVRVDGNKTISDEEIKFIADTCGLRPGVVKYNLDKRKISELVLAAEPRISWAWPEIRGVVLYLHVREKEQAQPPVDVKKPCNVIASRDGIIKEITVKRGREKVSEGDSVVAGQILISGYSEEVKSVHAEGEVKAVWWSEVKRSVPESIRESEPTGESKSYYSLILGDFGMNFRFGRRLPYDDFEIEEKEYPLKLMKDLVLPFTWKKTTYHETEERIKSQDADKIIEEMKKEFQEKLSEGIEINDVLVSKEPYEGGTAVRLIFECEGNIALKAYTEE